MNAAVALAEIVLALSGLGILMVGVLLRQADFRFASLLTIAAFIVAALLVAVEPHGTGLFGAFVTDGFSTFMKLLVLAGAVLAVLMSLDTARETQVQRYEFPVMMLFATIGMMLMISAADLMTLYLGVELQSLSLYVLAAFARDEPRATEAGLKYFVLGSLASGLLLYGISLVWGFGGSMDFAVLAHTLSAPAVASKGLLIGLVFVISGLVFKVSAVPFHMWTPDVYEGAPTPVTAFMSTAPKVAGIALLLRVMMTPFGHLAAEWQQVIVLVSVLSMALGAFAAISQHNIKRLMAYSSIGHVGYALIGLAAGSAVGLRGVLIYMLTYVFMNAGTFGCILAMRRRGHLVEEISDLAGLARNDPLLAFAFAIFMFSMAGIPPFAGFWGKYFIFAAAVQSGMWTLAVLGVLLSVVGAFYYIRIIKVMYFDEAKEAFDLRPASLSLVVGIGAVFTTFFFVVPAPFVAAATLAVKALAF